MFRPITKWCNRVMSVGAIPDAVHEAMRQMGTGRPRPVELEIPWDVLPARGDAELPEAEVFAKQSPDPSKIKEAAELLAGARRPLIWAGGGTIRGEASAEVMELATTLNAPVITTHQAKGIIPETSPLSLGTFYSGHGPGYRTLPQCDVILAVGSRLHLTPKVPWAFRPHQKLIHIDADPEELGRNHSTHVGIAADSKAGLRALLAELGSGAGASEWSSAELAAIKDETYREIKDMAPLQVEIIETLRRELDDDAIVVAGTTDVGYWSYLAFPVLTPRSYLTTSYFATLGFSFPTAVGAKIGNPDRQVVALCGDGGFMYGVPDLGTAVQEGANLVSIVFNNGAYGASMSDQRTQFGGREYGTRLHNPDSARMAESFGAVGGQAERPRGAGGCPSERPQGGRSRGDRRAHAGSRPAFPDIAAGTIRRAGLAGSQPPGRGPMQPRNRHKSPVRSLAMAVRFLRRSGIGVVEISGMIGGALRVPVYSRILDAVRSDRRFRSVIVEIDSPGGTASGSELLYRSLARVREEKPVVAYIRGTGASGAYYIACAASKVVALPTSLVGSIGVIYLRPVLEQLLEKLGVSFSVYKGGRLKDMGGFWRAPTLEEEGKLTGLIDEIYENFVGVVARERGMELDRARELATGELFTGRGAQKHGLVDELGDFDNALDLAAELGKTRRRPVWVRPKRGFLERFSGRIGGTAVGGGLVSELERLLAGGLYYVSPGHAGLGTGFEVRN